MGNNVMHQDIFVPQQRYYGINCYHKRVEYEKNDSFIIAARLKPTKSLMYESPEGIWGFF